MKTTKLFLGCVLTATLFIACNSDTSASKRSGVAQDALPPVQPVPNAKPDIYLYLVTVNNLLLRDQPTKTGSKVVSKFQSGDFVEGTGEVSDKKEEAIIREIPMTEPYYRVVSTTPEQFKGWAFGGALLPVYAGDRRNSPDMGKLSQFALFLKSLNPKKLDSGKKAWDYVKSNFANANGSLADASFIMMEFFLRQMIAEGEFYTMTEKIQWAEEDYNLIDANKFDVNKYPATKSIADNGFSLAVGEGMVFPMVDWQKLNDFFASKVTPPMKAFINQTLLEDKAQAWSDGGIIIPFEQIADRVRRRGLIFIISDVFADVEMFLKGVKHLRFQGHDVTLFHVMHPDEINFPFTGNVKFDGLEVPEEIKTRPHLIRPAYLRVVQEYFDELRSGCDAYRVDYVRASTDVPLEQTLSKYLITRLQMGRL